MNKLTGSKIMLSIETATSGGSLSLLANSREIDGWSGTPEISKAEDILEQISKLLSANKIENKNVKLICVSSGTGSSTGERIGWAIGKGLAKAFGCQLLGVSILESLLLEVENEPDGEYITALPFGKNFICRQKFIKTKKSFSAISAIEISEVVEFYKSAESYGCKKLVVAANVANNLQDLLTNTDTHLFVKNRCNIATLNGRTAFNHYNDCYASDNVKY